MGKRTNHSTTSPLRRAVRAVGRAVSRFTKRSGGAEVTAAPAERTAAASASAQPSRGVKRQTDIPMDILAAAYTPTQTSLKAGFRADGSDQHRDQEYGRGAEDDRWRAEDRFTNKSGDPRIGTHGRTYEPNENRASTTEGDNEWTRTRP